VTSCSEGDLGAILCVNHHRTVGNDNCIRFGKPDLQIPSSGAGGTYVRVTVEVRQYDDGALAIFHDRTGSPTTRPTGSDRSGGAAAIGRLSPLGGRLWICRRRHASPPTPQAQLQEADIFTWPRTTDPRRRTGEMQGGRSSRPA
jgi:hypothetical protein